MWVYDPARVCIKCGKKDTAFFAQRGKATIADPKRKRISINNVCHQCKTEYKSKYWYSKAKLLAYLKDKNNMYAREKL